MVVVVVVVVAIDMKACEWWGERTSVVGDHLVYCAREMVSSSSGSSSSSSHRYESV